MKKEDASNAASVPQNSVTRRWMQHGIDWEWVVSIVIWPE